MDVQIEYVHASKFGNGARVAEEFRTRMGTHGIPVTVHHIEADLDPKALPSADLYVFSSPGRMGKPIRGMRRFLKAIRLPEGTRYALLTTEMAPQPDRETGRVPTEEEICRFQRVRPIMKELLGRGGLVEIDEEKVYVTGVEGPLEEGWEEKVDAYADRVAAAVS